MSAEIVTQRSIEYTSNLQLLSQQLGSRLRGTVMTGNHRGKQAVPVDQIGAVDVYDVVGRRSQNNYVDTPHRRRWVFPQRRAVHDTVDISDEVENLANPGSMYARAQAAAMGRKIDRVILQALTGTSTTGETGTGTEAFDTTNNRFGTGSVLTFAKINQAVRILREQMKEYGEPLYCALGARSIQALLAETQFSSADYNSVRVLVNGELNTFMGINFVPTEEAAALTISADFGLLVYAKSGGHFGIWEDVNGRVDVLPELEHTTQISTYSNFGATRIEQAKVVWVQHT
jgi:hypothetical protein